MSRVVGILQPGYLPWLGFFEQVRRSHVFVIYDDVQYDKHGWRNRNRIKGPQGPVWLTVPVRTRGKSLPLNNQVEIDHTQPAWAKKHLGTIRQYYAKAPYFDAYYPALQAVLSQSWRLLLDLDIALINLLKDWLGIATPIMLSSQLACHDTDPTKRLIMILSALGASVFYEGASGRNYLDRSQFEQAGINLFFQDFQPVDYPQQFDGFVPYLSAVDLVFNCGPESVSYLGGPSSENG